MYEYVKGTLIESGPLHAIVEVYGVGYKLFLPVNSFPRLPEAGSFILLYSSYIVRETAHVLYGFLNREERDLFELLITVSGIGPKIAISLLGHLNFKDLVTAITTSQHSILSKVPGIGKKTAERLILEIKDKLSSSYSIGDSGDLKDPSTEIEAQKIKDAMSALINLGYPQSTAQRAIKQVIKEVNSPTELAELITFALQRC